jgi:hypothetical protein
MILCALFTLIAVQAQAFPGGMAGQQNGAPAAAGQGAPQAPSIQGTVVETMNAGGYTYVCVENGGQKQWAATPPAEVKVGDVVEIAPGYPMRNFPSPSLGRTFETITFSGGLIKK